MGIVTGIGDKSLNKNVITPKIDADLNDYILNKNCIINGLEVIGSTLTAGMCVLKGYRGVLETGKTITASTYIYGTFTLYFNNEVVDDFDIEFSDTVYTEPVSITSPGTYYLLLYTYTNGAYVLNPELNTPTYPAHAYEADETDLVKSGAVIESGVTATTQTVNDNSDKVATTEYVHNQIDAEIDYGTYTGNFVDSNNNVMGTYTLKRKSKYIIGTATLVTSTAGGTLSGVWATFPQGYRPKTTIYFGVYQKYSSLQTLRILQCTTNGEVSTAGNLAASAGNWDNPITTFGYETN